MNVLSAPTLADVGVIIPMFNSGRKAIAAIQSVFAQANFKVQEIVVVDDGSQDDSSDFLHKACSGMSIPVHIFRIMNGGAANARNFGIHNCNCDLYAFLDSDDIWLPTKLERQLPIFTDPSVAMVGCLTTMGGRVARSSNSTGLKIVGLRQQLFKNHFQTSTVIVRRSVIESLGPFPVNQRYAEEGDLFNRITARYRCVLIPEVLVDYGHGKEGFGVNGLSANLFGMEKGELSNIRRAFRRRDCGYGLYFLASVFSLAKFLKRYLITLLRRLCGSA